MHRIVASVQRVCLMSLVVGFTVLSAFFLQSSSAFAQAPCGLGAPIVIPDTPLGSFGDCTMTITETVISGGLALANDAGATVTSPNITLNGANQPATFAFHSVIADYRGATNGWVLEAALNGETFTPPGGTATAVTPGTVSIDSGTEACAAGSCSVTPAFTPLPGLSTTPAPFWAAGGSGNTTVVDGTYTLTTNGTVNLAAGTAAGTYALTLTVTLVNTY